VEPLLAKTFSPEEMNGLRQAHTILGSFKEAEKCHSACNIDPPYCLT
jgi:hypothetical protein